MPMNDGDRHAATNVDRRESLAVATGIPAGILLKGRRAFAEGAACDSSKAQFIILNTSGNGDPINANVPGTYEDPSITHSADPLMAPTQFTLGGAAATAAAPWL